MHLCFLFLIASCSADNQECENKSFAPLSGYKIYGQTFSPEDIHSDVPNNYDLDILDRVTDEVYTCIQKTFPSLVLPDHVVYDGWCYDSKITLKPRSCFQVKVSQDWKLSCDGTQQLLKDEAPIESCKEKGLDQDFSKCPCSWRAAIQNNDDGSPIIVTTPSLYLYKDPLLRYLTSCDYPWSVDELSSCMATSTDPLSLNVRN